MLCYIPKIFPQINDAVTQNCEMSIVVGHSSVEIYNLWENCGKRNYFFL